MVDPFKVVISYLADAKVTDVANGTCSDSLAFLPQGIQANAVFPALQVNRGKKMKAGSGYPRLTSETAGPKRVTIVPEVVKDTFVDLERKLALADICRQWHQLTGLLAT